MDQNCFIHWTAQVALGLGVRNVLAGLARPKQAVPGHGPLHGPD